MSEYKIKLRVVVSDELFPYSSKPGIEVIEAPNAQTAINEVRKRYKIELIKADFFEAEDIRLEILDVVKL